MNFQDFWNTSYESYKVDKDEYSQWLNSYIDVIEQCTTDILDLGCGIGCDSMWLSRKGFNVVACDFSQVALDRLKKESPNIQTQLVDITKKLPFKDCSFDIIIADLSLHYFDEQTTHNIIKEIKRVLTEKGVLIARVNSMMDFNHGAGQGEKVEENYYFVHGYNKRFFNKEEIDKYFLHIGKVSAREMHMLRNNNSKIVWEIVAER